MGAVGVGEVEHWVGLSLVVMSTTRGEVQPASVSGGAAAYEAV